MHGRETPPDVNSGAPTAPPAQGQQAAAATAVADWLGIARDAHTASCTWFDASVRTEIERDIRQFQGRHPAGSKYLSELYKNRSRLFRPKTRAAIRKNEALASEAFFSTVDVVSVTPDDGDDEVQLAAAEVHKALLQYRLTNPEQIKWFMILLGAYQEAQKVGVVASHQHWVYDEKKKKDQPAIELLPIESLKFDPGSNWTDPINTSPYVIREVPMFVKDVKAMARTKGWAAPSEAQLLAAKINVVDSIRAQREGQRTDSQQAGPQSINDFTLVQVHQNIVEWEGVDYVYWTLKTIALLSNPVPLEDEYWHGRRPFTLGVYALEAHIQFPGGLPRMSRDVQQEINDVANLRNDNVKFVLNKRYFVKRNRQVDTRSLTRNVPGSATMMDDPETDVKVVDFTDVTGSAYQEHDRLNSDFDELAGTFSQSSVESNRRLSETVGGMQLLSNTSNQVSNYGLRTFVETWVEPTLYQVMLLEAHYEDDEKILALAFKKAQVLSKYGQALTERGLLQVDPNDPKAGAMSGEFLLQPVRLRVNVGMGATNPTEQVNQFGAAMRMIKDILADGVLERYGVKVHEIIKEVMGKLGHSDGSRFFETGDDPRIQTMMQTIQELKAALDAKQPPEVIAATVEKLKADAEAANAKRVLTGVQASFAAMQGGQIVAAQPLVTPVADQILMAAGWRPPQPAGVDPNFQPPAGAGATQPAAQMAAAVGTPTPPPDATNTSPGFPPNAATGEEGATAGIETPEADS